MYVKKRIFVQAPIKPVFLIFKTKNSKKMKKLNGNNGL